MTPPRDPFDPDHPPPHWVDQDGNFCGWLSEAEAAVMAAARTDSEAPAHEIDLADLLASRDATDDEFEF